MALTKRDLDLLGTLLLRVRYLSLQQVARTWWGETKSPEKNANCRLQRLESGGLIHRFSVVVHPEIVLEQPLFKWAPGKEAPDFGAIAYLLAGRWSENYAPTPAFIASEKAARLLGGTGGKTPRASEETHDLHLATVYLLFRSQNPKRARSWIHEDSARRVSGEKVPDAYVGSGSGKVAIELAGKYPKEKLTEFHQYCVSRNLPYELW